MDERALASHEERASEEDICRFSTARFGEVSVLKEQILSFPRGLLGLPHAQRFVFLHRDDSQGPFFWMQAVDDPRLAFVVCEPQQFFPDYQVPLSREQQEFLSIQAAEKGVVCVILVVPSDPQRITANLRGPVVINPARRLGLQLVLAGDEYSVHEPIFTAKEDGGDACSS